MSANTEILFTNVRILDGTGEQLPYAGSVRVRGNRIVQVGRSAGGVSAGDALVVDGAGATLMPGMTEAHTHFSWNDAASLAGIQTMPLELPLTWNAPAWVILMGIEHERIHLETSSVIMRQMPLAELRHGDELSAEERRLWAACPTSGSAPANDWVPVPGRKIRLGKRPDDHTYGWDN
jgi:hypothetical protein